MHLSRRLKCTIVIIRCPSSVVHPSVVRRPSLTFTFLTSPLKPLSRIQRNLTGSKISTSSTMFVFFGPNGKTRWPHRVLIGWDTFDFFSETAEGNSTKLDRKQDLNVLYQVCVFRSDQKTKMAVPASDWLRHFRLLLWNRWTELEETWQEARSQCPLPSLCFSGRLEKTRWPPWPLICWDIFYFSSETVERNFMKLTGSKISKSSTKFVFFRLIGKPRWPPWPLIGGNTYITTLDYIVAQQTKTTHWLKNI